MGHYNTNAIIPISEDLNFKIFWGRMPPPQTILPFAFNREVFFHAGLLFKRDSFPDNCIDWTNVNVSFEARNYECLSKKCSTFWSHVVQV